MKQSELAVCISNKFLEADVIPKDDAEVMAYYLENIMSMLTFIIPVTLVAVCTDMERETVLYLTAFFIGRACCGGYHAKTHTSCLFLSLGTYFLFLCLEQLYCRLGQPLFVIAGMVLTSNILIFFFASADSANKRFSKSEYLKYRKKSLLVSLFQNLLFSLVIFQIVKWTFFAIFFGVFQLAVSVWIAEISDSGQKIGI